MSSWGGTALEARPVYVAFFSSDFFPPRPRTPLLVSCLVPSPPPPLLLSLASLASTLLALPCHLAWPHKSPHSLGLEERLCPHCGRPVVGISLPSTKRTLLAQFCRPPTCFHCAGLHLIRY